MSYVEGIEYGNGKTKRTVTNSLNVMLSQYTKGSHRDTSWTAINRLWKVLDNAKVNWVMQSAEYVTDRDTGEDSMKQWKFEVYFENNKGKQQTLYGTFAAYAAGTVKDPWDRYDITAHVS